MTQKKPDRAGGIYNGGSPLLGALDQVNYPWLKTFDATIGWTYNIKERVQIKPSVGFYTCSTSPTSIFRRA